MVKYGSPERICIAKKVGVPERNERMKDKRVISRRPKINPRTGQ